MAADFIFAASFGLALIIGIGEAYINKYRLITSWAEDQYRGFRILCLVLVVSLIIGGWLLSGFIA